MSWHFEPNRVTQAAAFLLKRSGEARMSYVKMLKLLYFADRKSITEKGFPITGDEPYAMDYGPVLTHVYDYIKYVPRKGAHVWSRFFRTDGFELERKDDPGQDELSKYDRRILTEVYDEHKDLDGFDMSRLSHDFPEWQAAYSEGTATLIPLEKILAALGFDENETSRIRAQKEQEQQYFERIEALEYEPDRPSGKLLPA